jgi:squalene-associated FAD-dependent desaturase
MSRGVVHIIGAGLAGLSCAVALASRNRRVIVHEAARHAGGRCRSYFDPALGLTIDNGNHLVLSGNRATLAYLDTLGARSKLAVPQAATFPFADLKTGERWTLAINDGRVPWWVLSNERRVPATRARDYLGVLRLLGAPDTATVTERIGEGPAFDRLWRPVLLAALNTDPAEASARLAGAIVRETLSRGGRACRPLVAAQGLAATFIEPALAYLARYGGNVRFERRLKALACDGGRVEALDFAQGERIELAVEDHVVLAVPAHIAQALLPSLKVPSATRAILNAHFKVGAPGGWPRLMGLIHGVSEWLFAFEDRLAVTVSCADRLIDAPREELASMLWGEIAALLHLEPALPPWQIVKERRATFAALAGVEAERPGTATLWSNLALAGDWTATGLPATIEGAIRSGNRAAALLVAA